MLNGAGNPAPDVKLGLHRDASHADHAVFIDPAFVEGAAGAGQLRTQSAGQLPGLFHALFIHQPTAGANNNARVGQRRLRQGVARRPTPFHAGGWQVRRIPNQHLAEAVLIGEGLWQDAGLHRGELRPAAGAGHYLEILAAQPRHRGQQGSLHLVDSQVDAAREARGIEASSQTGRQLAGQTGGPKEDDFRPVPFDSPAQRLAVRFQPKLGQRWVIEKNDRVSAEANHAFGCRLQALAEQNSPHIDAQPIGEFAGLAHYRPGQRRQFVGFGLADDPDILIPALLFGDLVASHQTLQVIQIHAILHDVSSVPSPRFGAVGERSLTAAGGSAAMPALRRPLLQARRIRSRPVLALGDKTGRGPRLSGSGHPLTCPDLPPSRW